jgi:hypothetical protein
VQKATTDHMTFDEDNEQYAGDARFAPEPDESQGHFSLSMGSARRAMKRHAAGVASDEEEGEEVEGPEAPPAGQPEPAPQQPAEPPLAQALGLHPVLSLDVPPQQDLMGALPPQVGQPAQQQHHHQQQQALMLLHYHPQQQQQQQVVVLLQQPQPPPPAPAVQQQAPVMPARWEVHPAHGKWGGPCPSCGVERSPDWRHNVSLVGWVQSVTTCSPCASYAKRHRGARRSNDLINEKKKEAKEEAKKSGVYPQRPAP